MEDNREKVAFFAMILGPTFAKHHRLAATDLQAALDAYRAIQAHIESGQDFVKPATGIMRTSPKVPAWPVALAEMGSMRADPPAVVVHVPNGEE